MTTTNTTSSSNSNSANGNGTANRPSTVPSSDNGSKSNCKSNPSTAEQPTSSSKMTKMMMMAGSRFRVPRRLNNHKAIADGRVLDDDEDTTTTCNDAEFVSTGTVTFALSSVYYVECEEDT